MESTPELRLAVRLIDGLGGAAAVVNPWVQVLLNPEFDGRPELRNMAFTIIFAGLYDVVTGGDDRLAEIRREAADLGHRPALYYADLFAAVLDGAREVLGQYSEDETLWLRESRIQNVHGQLDRLHQDRITFPHVVGDTVRRVRLPASDYWERFRAFSNDRKSSCNALRRRWMFYPSLFWEVVTMVGQPECLIAIDSDLKQPKLEKFKVRFTFQNGSYAETVRLRQLSGPPLHPLADWRPTKPTPPEHDPAFP